MVIAQLVSERTAARGRQNGDGRLPDDNDVLLERIALGDRDAFEALYDNLAPSVHGLVCRVLRSPALAEEATQEVFLTVWRKAASFDRSRGGARTWILTIAHRRAVDVVRHEQSRRDWLAQAATADVQRATDVVSEQVLERASAREASDQVSFALGALTELQRTAVELAYFDGLTYVQVAERLQIPVPTAKTRIRDGLRRMATQMQLEGRDATVAPLRRSRPRPVRRPAVA